MDFLNISATDEKRLIMAKALSDPIRLRLFYFLYEPHTAKEAAEALGIKQTGLYYHLKILEEANLLVVVDEKKVRNLTMKIYKAIQDIVFDRHETTEPGSKVPYFDIIKGLAYAT